MDNASLKNMNPDSHKPERVPASLKVARRQFKAEANLLEEMKPVIAYKVDTFDGIPEWYFKTTLPPQRCVVVPNESGNYDAACKVVDQYVADNGLVVDAEGRKYTICERYNYEGEGFAKYSLPIRANSEGER